jgi:YgiT-type zinc finger domain-containing protein
VPDVEVAPELDGVGGDASPHVARTGAQHDGKRVLLVTLFLRYPMNAMRCPACCKGELVPSELEDHEMGPWLGLESVRVERVPALRCDACGGVTFDGAVLDAILRATARLLVRQAGDLWPTEARFLRKFLADTQMARVPLAPLRVSV